MTTTERADGHVRAPRKNGLDAFRLLSVLFVVGAHANVYSGPVQLVAPILAKWSVPYFFLVLGYFLGKKTDRSRTSAPIERVAWMFGLACLLLLPLGLLRDGPAQVLDYVAHNGLFSGTYFHLWYLNSLLMGLLVLRLFDTPSRRAWLGPVAILTLIASVTLASYVDEEFRYLGRHLMSVPFLWIGTRLTRAVPSMRQSVALVLLGIGLEAVESQLLHGLFGREIWRCPLTAGTVLYAIGMFGIAFHLPASATLAKLGQLGGRYSGSIYVTHLYALACLGLLGSALHVKESMGFRLLVIPAAFLLNLAVLWLVDRFSPHFVDGLLGNRRALGQWPRTLLRLPRFALRTLRAQPSRS